MLSFISNLVLNRRVQDKNGIRRVRHAFAAYVPDSGQDDGANADDGFYAVFVTLDVAVKETEIRVISLDERRTGKSALISEMNEMTDEGFLSKSDTV